MSVAKVLLAVACVLATLSVCVNAAAPPGPSITGAIAGGVVGGALLFLLIFAVAMVHLAHNDASTILSSRRALQRQRSSAACCITSPPAPSPVARSASASSGSDPFSYSRRGPQLMV
ncbi:hypothetical protein T484DRAFT_1928190 [Baffinella frigidus]|nr:hypothetical protein T484DRAFT_1928190 [Cryptophyta sp. CCMP2293]